MMRRDGLKQPLWQIYLPPPKFVPRYHWIEDRPNHVHQADLLFVTHDTIEQKTYKYILVVVDVAARYVYAEALPNKYAASVAKAFQRIYSRRLTYPKTLMVDSRKEFKGAVNKLMKEHDVHIQRGVPKNHEHKPLWKEQIKLWVKDFIVISMHN